MNRSGLKTAARQCLRDAHTSPMRLTLLFMLCLYGVSIPINVLTFFMDQNINQLSGLAAMATRNQYTLWSMVLSFGVSLLSVLWSAGYTAFSLQLSRGHRAGFDDFFTGFRRAGRVLILTFLMFLYIWLWSMLFIIPGLVASYRYRMALLILLDNPDVTPSEAIRLSKRLTYGHKAELLFLDLSFFWYHLLVMLAGSVLVLFSYDLLPMLHGTSGYLTAYAVGVVLDCALMTLFGAYVQTTYAHAYNWLLSLDKARCEGTTY